jgi:gas vesicle protein
MHTTFDDRQPRTDSGFLLGLLAGAAVGGGLALLFAPQEGADTRQALATRGQQAGRRLNDAYGTMAAQVRRRARRFSARTNQEEGSAPGAHANGQSTLVAAHTDERTAGPTSVAAP